MTPLNLHIGGTEAHPDWKILDIEARPEVDFVGNASDLSQFADGSIDKIYASHVLEHFHHALNDELLITLREWHRVLKPGGYLLVSVPDLKTLCWLFLNPAITPRERHEIMCILFGGQVDAYDVHKVGFDVDILRFYLTEAGFADFQQVSEWTLFNDCSRLRLANTLISLNVMAQKLPLSVDCSAPLPRSQAVGTVRQQLKILVINSLYPPQVIGGYERSMADLAGLLHQRGHVVQVLTSNNPQFATHYSSCYACPPIDRRLRWAGEWNQRSAPEWFSEAAIVEVMAHNRQILDQLHQTFQPDICLLGDMTLLDTSLIEHLLQLGVPIAHYVMNKHPGYVPELAPRSTRYQYITCSNWVAQALQQAGYATETAKTVYPGAAVEAFYQPQLPPRDQLRIAYASLVMHYKGADVLIEALSFLHALGIEFTATIAGGTLSPHYVATLKEFVATEGMSDIVTFPGVLSRSELSQLYQTHNVLVFPSRFEEPFGISQVEAMAAGLTLVTSGTGGAKELIKHGQDGLLFESENPLDLAESLSSLLEHPEHWAAIAQSGQQTALTRFSHSQAVEQLEAVLFNLVQIRESEGA